MLKVFSGRFKNSEIKSSKNIRPTKGLVKEAVFNIINNNPEIPKRYFLDMFAGSGNIGIESLSNGFKTVFIEKYRSLCNVICSNLSGFNIDFKFITKEKLNKCNVEKKTLIVCDDAVKTLDFFNCSFDVIYIDPPYASSYGIKILRFPVFKHLLSDRGIIFFETNIEKKEIFDNINEHLVLEKIKSFGETKLIIYRRGRYE